MSGQGSISNPPAVKVQQQVPIHDRDQPPDRGIRFRIGINLGDALADGTDLHGERPSRDSGNGRDHSPTTLRSSSAWRHDGLTETVAGRFA